MLNRSQLSIPQLQQLLQQLTQQQARQQRYQQHRQQQQQQDSNYKPQPHYKTTDNKSSKTSRLEQYYINKYKMKPRTESFENYKQRKIISEKCYVEEHSSRRRKSDLRSETQRNIELQPERLGAVENPNGSTLNSNNPIEPQTYASSLVRPRSRSSHQITIKTERQSPQPMTNPCQKTVSQNANNRKIKSEPHSDNDESQAPSIHQQSRTNNNEPENQQRHIESYNSNLLSSQRRYRNPYFNNNENESQYQIGQEPNALNSELDSQWGYVVPNKPETESGDQQPPYSGYYELQSQSGNYSMVRYSTKVQNDYYNPNQYVPSIDLTIQNHGYDYSYQDFSSNQYHQSYLEIQPSYGSANNQRSDSRTVQASNRRASHSRSRYRTDYNRDRERTRKSRHYSGHKYSRR